MMWRYIYYLFLALGVLTVQVHAQDGELFEPITSENASSMVEIGHWQGKAQFVRQLTFSPDGKHLLALNNDWSCNCDRGQFLDTSSLVLYESGIKLTNASAVAWSLDASHLAVADYAGLITIYSIDTLEVASTIQVETSGEPIQNIALSPQNRYLAIGFGGPELVTLASTVFQVFDLTTKQPILSLDRSSSDIDEIFATGVAFSVDETYLVLSTSDGLVYRWDIASGEKVAVGDSGIRGSQILVQTNDNLSAYLTPRGVSLLSDTTRVRELSVSQMLDETREVLLSSIAAHPTEPILAIGYTTRDIATPPVASRNNIIEIWNLRTETIAGTISVSQSAVNEVLSLAFSPDGTLLASGGSDGTVRLWGIPAGA
jgi:WD40 repeat protein